MNRKWRPLFRFPLFSAQRWRDTVERGKEKNIGTAAKCDSGSHFSRSLCGLKLWAECWTPLCRTGAPTRQDNKKQPQSWGQRNGLRRAELLNSVEDYGGSTVTCSSVLHDGNCTLYQCLWKMICKQYDLFANPILHFERGLSLITVM